MNVVPEKLARVFLPRTEGDVIERAFTVLVAGHGHAQLNTLKGILTALDHKNSAHAEVIIRMIIESAPSTEELLGFARIMDFKNVVSLPQNSQSALKTLVGLELLKTDKLLRPMDPADVEVVSEAIARLISQEASVADLAQYRQKKEEEMNAEISHFVAESFRNSFCQKLLGQAIAKCVLPNSSTSFARILVKEVSYKKVSQMSGEQRKLFIRDYHPA